MAVDSKTFVVKFGGENHWFRLTPDNFQISRIFITNYEDVDIQNSVWSLVFFNEMRLLLDESNYGAKPPEDSHEQDTTFLDWVGKRL